MWEKVFQGPSSLSVDVKGRLTIPAKYRDALIMGAEGKLTLTKHPDGCLLVFPRPEWERFRERVAALPMSALWWRRIFLGNALDVELDSAARMLVSSELRLAATLTKDAILLGMGSHFELWDAALYAAKEAEAMQGPMPDVLKDFSI